MAAIIGRRVTVEMDRPLGGRHPEYENIVYPVNYGFVRGVPAPDGDFQDAYVLGPAVPLPRFEGIVTAILIREDDCETKWIVEDPAARRLSDGEIMEAVRFQEQYFQTKITRQDG